MADQIALLLDGQRFEGWTSVTVQRALEGLAGSFSIGLTERFPGHPEKWAIAAGAPCQVLIGDDPVITGYINSAEYAVDAGSHRVTVSGRDKTGDLVDCSAVHKPGSWTGRKLEQIAADLAKPFGIGVKAVADTGEAFPRFALQQGETVFEAIDRLAKQRAVLAVTTETGDLEFRRPGSTRAGYRLELGVNLESIRFTNEVKDRFSLYILKGYPTTSSGDFLFGTQTTKRQPSAQAADPDITRYRPLMIIHEDATSGSPLKDRAKWEATVRAGKGQQVVAGVSGWRAANGELYRIDRLVQVVAPLVGVDAELLVSGVAYRRDERGTRTELTLTRKEAFSLTDLPDKHKKKKGKGVDPLLNLQ